MKILLITYTYPPAKSVNGFRPYSFANHFVQAGCTVSVLTRHYTGDESFIAYEPPIDLPWSTSLERGVTVYRIPFTNSWFHYFKYDWIKHSGLWRIFYLFNLLIGRTTQESYNKWFHPFVKNILGATSYDLLMVESGPTNLVQVVGALAAPFNLPYVIDFRDAYYHEMYLKDGRSISLSKKIKIILEKHFMKKSIRNSALNISLSDNLLNVLDIPIDKRLVVSNGYDEEVWSTLPKPSYGAHFKLTIAGSLYDREFLGPFLTALKIFLESHHHDCEILFIAPGSDTIIQKIHTLLPFDAVKIIRTRISYKDTLEEINTSQVLAYHGWAGYQGYPSAKIFDYIRSNKPILITPSDHDVIDELITRTQTGKSFDKPEAAAAQLQNWYTEWKSTGSIQVTPNSNEIRRYSRQAQNVVLLNSLNALMASRNKAV